MSYYKSFIKPKQKKRSKPATPSTKAATETATKKDNQNIPQPDLSHKYDKSFLKGFTGVQRFFAKALGPAYVKKHGRERATQMINNLSIKPENRSY